MFIGYIYIVAYSDNYTNLIAFTSDSTSTNNADVDLWPLNVLVACWQHKCNTASHKMGNGL
jgi:hypothetical protein